MDTSLLTNRTISVIHTFECFPIPVAWIDALTTPIATSMAFLELSDGKLLRVAPCEVEVNPGKYPSLGLIMEPCERNALRESTPSGRTLVAQPLSVAPQVLPLTLLRIEQSDPLREGTTSEFQIVGTRHQQVIFRHIMPPMTLGIDVANPGQAPNQSLERTREG